MNYPITLIIFLPLYSVNKLLANKLNQINLPPEHMPYYYYNFPEQRTLGDHNLIQKKCWGYEDDCDFNSSYSVPVCTGDHKGWVKSKQDQINTFYTQADFGYIKERRSELSLMCEPTYKEDSSLECSKHLTFCRGRNIMINFTSLNNRLDMIRYKMDVLSDGEIGGYCKFNKDRLIEECDQISPLQSWSPELRFFTQLDSRPTCEVNIERPTYLLKIDATVNMYHHFCDFFNLYASQHVNLSNPLAFSTDVHLLIWENYNYYSNFGDMWKVFSDKQLWNLNSFKGKVVCFKNIVFPLLPRMIFGLFYNTPLIWGCEKSGLFHAFSKHVLYRLQIPEYKRKFADKSKLTVTFLSRNTSYRNILNEKELIISLRNTTKHTIQRVVFSKEISFKKQLEIIRNTDILIGMHGAGLTHSLFLPDWGAVFELYNCEDQDCYKDLARLRGIKYITWENRKNVFAEDQGHHPSDGGAHAKFTNYKFETEEFLRLFKMTEKHVKKHPGYKNIFKNNTIRDEL